MHDFKITGFLSIEWQKKNNLTCNVIYNQSVSIVTFKNDKYLITKQRLTTVTRRLRQQARPSAKPVHLYLESSEKWSTVKKQNKNQKQHRAMTCSFKTYMSCYSTFCETEKEKCNRKKSWTYIYPVSLIKNKKIWLFVDKITFANVEPWAHG